MALYHVPRAIFCLVPRRIPSSQARILLRSFHVAAARRTDGVYKALTEMRVRTPWIEAYRNSQKTGDTDNEVPKEQIKSDLTPKRMSDSRFELVGRPRAGSGR